MNKAEIDRRLIARRLIDACERNLLRPLSRGERIDLLADNTKWPLSVCREIAALTFNL